MRCFPSIPKSLPYHHQTFPHRLSPFHLWCYCGLRQLLRCDARHVGVGAAKAEGRQAETLQGLLARKKKQKRYGTNISHRWTMETLQNYLWMFIVGRVYHSMAFETEELYTKQICITRRGIYVYTQASNIVSPTLSSQPAASVKLEAPVTIESSTR